MKVERHRRTVTCVGAALVFAFGISVAAVENWQSNSANALCVVWLLFLAHGLSPFTESRYRIGSQAVLPRYVMSVVVIIPIFNEDWRYLERCLEALDGQAHAPDAVCIVDDGSTESEALRLAQAWAARSHRFAPRVMQLASHEGKRSAQAHAFREYPDADIFVTVDSDTILDRQAIHEGLLPFADKTVMGVAGLITGHNWRHNLLTRLIDVDCVSAFVTGRAMSSFGALLTTRGSLALYRGAIVRENLADYLSQTVLGITIDSGDDTRLTQYALLAGKVVVQETARARTALPEGLSHLVRQRLRWGASSYRTMYWMAREMPAASPAYWWGLAQFVEVGLFVVLALGPLFGMYRFNLELVGGYIGFVLCQTGVRSARYVSVKKDEMTPRERLVALALAPAVAFLYTVVLLPIRYLSVLKVRDRHWLTRTRVELIMGDDAS